MAEYPPTRNRARMRWRQGAGHGLTTTIYAQTGDKPSPDDDIVCVADTPELAVHIIAAHNSMLYPKGPSRCEWAGSLRH